MTTNNYQWYVLQTMSGMEDKVERRIVAEYDKVPESARFKELIQEIKIPKEKVLETKEGKRRTRECKIFPGYILMKIALLTEEGKINEPLWYFIRNINGVIGFAGGGEPVALSEEEVIDILEQTEEGRKVRHKVAFEIGEKVVIKEGSFCDYEATVEAVNNDSGKLKLAVNIFGRSTPVEVESWQVERSV